MIGVMGCVVWQLRTRGRWPARPDRPRNAEDTPSAAPVRTATAFAYKAPYRTKDCCYSTRTAAVLTDRTWRCRSSTAHTSTHAAANEDLPSANEDLPRGVQRASEPAVDTCHR